MPNEYAAFASDFYVNQRLNLKMDLSLRRETVLSLFDRVRREPHMERFRRYPGELALESRSELHGAYEGGQQWLAVRKTSVRTGSVNPAGPEAAYGLHALVLANAPCFLDISSLDIENLELLYGFDLPAAGNHDAIVFNALLGGSPLASLVDHLADHHPRSTAVGDARSHRAAHIPVDCQPLLGVALTEGLDVQAHVEIKTRTSARQVRTGEYRDDPISLYLIVRRYAPVKDVRDLPEVMHTLAARAEDLISRCIAPKLLAPIREAIAAGS